MLLGWVCLIFGVGDALTNLSFDIPFAFRGPVVPEEVVIVYMDEESHAALGQQPRFDLWDRTIHAQLIRKMRDYGAKAVAFDVWFDNTNNVVADRALVEAVRANGSVAVAAVVGVVTLNRQTIGTEPLRPFPALLSAAKAWGMVESGEGERTIRRHYQGEFNIPSLAWRTASLTTSDLPGQGEPRWMNYYGPPGTIPHESYHRVLSNAVPASVFSNKVVYVGALFSVGYSGGRGTDDFLTPYSRWAPYPKSSGVEVNATTYLNLVRGDWLRRMPPIAELLALLATGALAGMGLTRLNPLRATSATGAAALAVTVMGCSLPLTMQWWFPWMIVVAIQLPTALACVIVLAAQRATEIRAPEKQTPVVALTPTRTLTAPPDEGGQLTAEVLQQMARLRESSGMTPGPLQRLQTIDSSRGPNVPDHQLLQCVGRGAYGEVWLARNIMGRFRAVKIVYRKSFKEDRPYEREFDGIRKFEPISRSHPGLVQILHVGRNDAAGYYFYLMETADDTQRGQEFTAESYTPKTLTTVIQQHRGLAAAECVAIAGSLTSALGYLHGQGLIHRDIKPSNIIFVNNEPKLADIGLVTDIGNDRTFVGTAGYFPPEGPGTPSADLYSLGKVLYELITGLDRGQFPELPTAFNSREQGREMSALNKIILKACRTTASRRYATAEAMLADLQTVMRREESWFAQMRRSFKR